jgi:hypothetical protein
MKTNLKLLRSLNKTVAPTAPPAVAARRLQGGSVLLKGQLATGEDGQARVFVSMDSAAVARMIAVQDATGRAVSTTGKDSIFGSI